MSLVGFGGFLPARNDQGRRQALAAAAAARRRAKCAALVGDSLHLRWPQSELACPLSSPPSSSSSCVLALDALRAETAVSVGGRDKTARFWKIVDESQLVFRGGGRSAIRELLEGGALEGLEEDGEEGTSKKREDGETKKFVEGSLECVAMIDESLFLTGGDSGCVCSCCARREHHLNHN